MSVFVDGAVKEVLVKRLDCPVYTVTPADPGKKFVDLSHVGGGDLDERFPSTRAAVSIHCVARDYTEVWELSQQVHQALLEAEALNEKTSWGYIAFIRVYEAFHRQSLQHAPGDEWRFAGFYGITIT